jgi:hypothetical protein
MAFASCKSLSVASFPACSFIGANAFSSCETLESLYLLGSSVAALAGSIANLTTSSAVSIYVPAPLYSSYLAQSNWAVYASRIVSYGASGDSSFSASTSLATLQLSGENISVSGTKLQLASEDVSVSGTKLIIGSPDSTSFSAMARDSELMLSGNNISVSGTKLQVVSENASVSGTKITLG